MEFDSSLWQLQREIKTLKLRDDNFMKDVVGSSKALSPLFDQFKESTESLVYYLVLSSDHGLTDALLDDPIVGFILNNAYQLESRWIISVLSSMNRLNLLMDIIRFGPVGVTLPLLKTLLVLSEKEGTGISIDPSEIADAMVIKILQLLSEKFTSSAALIEPIFIKVVTQLKNSVRSNVAFENNSDGKGIVEYGRAVHRYLSVLEAAIDAGFGNNSIDSSKANLYKIGGEYCQSASEVTQQLASTEQVIEFLMKNLADMLLIVSCDIWISWEECSFEINSTLQKSIGNKIYTINEKCRRSNLSIESNLQQCFNQLQIKPVTEDDELCNATLEIIAEKITKGDSLMLEKWYIALVEQGDAWRHSDTVDIILSNVSLSHCPQDILIKGLDSVLNIPDNHLKSLFLNSLKTLESSVQMEVLVEIMSRQAMRVFATHECHGDVTLAFNKISADSNVQDLLRETLIFLIQSPLHVMSHILELAICALENQSACLEILSFIAPVLKLDEFVDSGTGDEITGVDLFSFSMKRVLYGTHTDKEWRNLGAFLHAIAIDNNTEISASLITDCIVKVLEDNLNAQDWSRCKFLLTLLKAVIFEEFAAVPAPVILAFLAQVALRTSWDVTSFNGPKAEVNKICYEMIREVDHTNWKEDRGWLRDVTLKLPETVRSYFCDFWLEEELDYPGKGELYVSLLVSIRTRCEKYKDISQDRLVQDAQSSGHFESSLLLALFKILPVLHTSEWHCLYNLCCHLLGDEEESSPIVLALKFFSDAICILSLCTDSEIIPAFEFCMNNFTELFISISKEQLSLDQKLALFQYLLKPLDRINSATVRDNCYLLMLPVLLKFVKIPDVTNEWEQKLLPFINSVDENWREKFAKALRNSDK